MDLHLPSMPKRLNLACGSLPFAGMINYDKYAVVDGKPLPVDVVGDALDLPFEDDSFDSIFASHIFEHFSTEEGKIALREWRRVLKPDGWLEAEMPCLDRLCVKYLSLPEWQRGMLFVQFFGNWDIPGHGHKRVYSALELTSAFWEAGFKEIIELPALRYADLSDACIKLCGRK